jgi:hypothetical protein
VASQVVLCSITFNTSAQKVVICYGRTNAVGYGIVGTVSGTSISFGTAVDFNGTGANSSNNMGSVYDAGSGKTIITFRDQAGSAYGAAVVGTVSGTSISFGTKVIFSSFSNYFGASPNPNNSVYDSVAQKIATFYHQSAGTTGMYGIVGTVSGTSITFGTAVKFDDGNGSKINGAYDSFAQKIVLAYGGNNVANASIVTATISGTSISFGTRVDYDTYADVDTVQAVYDPVANVTSVFSGDYQTSSIAYRTATVSGTNVTLSASTAIAATNVNFIASVYDTTAARVVSTYEANSSQLCLVVRNQSTNSADFIGITDQAIANAATGSVVVEGGVITNSSFNIALVTGTETNLTGKTQSPYPVITYDITNSKFVVFFQDGNNSNYGTSVVVTVSGTTVTFGTPVVFNSGSTNYIDATYSESNGKHLVVYPDYGNSQQATAIVGTVSGTSISFGSEQVYDTGTVNTRVSVAYNSNLDKYLAGSTPSSGTINVTVLTVSGTTVSAGTPVSLSGTKYKPNIASNESASDFVLGNNKNDNQSEAHLISVSGTVPTVETSIDLSAVVSSSFPSTGLAFLESNKFVCVYSDNSTNSMYTRTITVSGTSLSLGTASSAFTVDPNPQTSINGAWPLFKATTTSAYLYYQDDTSNYLKYVPISISGTTATSGTEVTYTSETSNYEGFLYSADAKQSLSFFQSTDSGQQTAAIAQNASLTTYRLNLLRPK